MEISRSGSDRYAGQYSIKLKQPTCQWKAENREVVFKKQRVKNFSGEAHHDYEVLIPLSEVGAILECLTKEGSDGGRKAISEGLGPYLGSLLKLSVRSLL